MDLLHVLGFCFLGFDLVVGQSHLCIAICDGDYDYDSRKLVNGDVPVFDNEELQNKHSVKEETLTIFEDDWRESFIKCLKYGELSEESIWQCS